MGFITSQMAADRDELQLVGSPLSEWSGRQSAAELFCDPLALEYLKDRICAEVTRQFMKRGRVAMVLVSAPGVTEELHRDEGCGRELLSYLQSHEPRTNHVELLFHKGDGGLALPRVLVTFQPMLTAP